jgi:hypothetical protein
MERIAQSHRKRNEKADEHQSISLVANNAEELGRIVNSVGRGAIESRRFGQSAIFFALGDIRSSLYGRLARKSIARFSDRLDSVRDAAAGLVIADRHDNALGIHTFLFRGEGIMSLLPGMTHPIWWPMPSEALEKVIFQDVMVVSLFNPAHVVVALERAGFEVVEGDRFTYRATKVIEGGVMHLEGMAFYMALIHSYLFSEEDVVNVIERTNGAFRDKPMGSIRRVDIWVEQRFGNMPGNARKA